MIFLSIQLRKKPKNIIASSDEEVTVVLSDTGESDKCSEKDTSDGSNANSDEKQSDDEFVIPKRSKRLTTSRQVASKKAGRNETNGMKKTAGKRRVAVSTDSDEKNQQESAEDDDDIEVLFLNGAAFYTVRNKFLRLPARFFGE